MSGVSSPPVKSPDYLPMDSILQAIIFLHHMLHSPSSPPIKIGGEGGNPEETEKKGNV